LPVWTQVQAVLERTDVILRDLSYYSGAATEIRDVCIAALL